jgi:hypothetical protein
MAEQKRIQVFAAQGPAPLRRGLGSSLASAAQERMATGGPGKLSAEKRSSGKQADPLHGRSSGTSKFRSHAKVLQ